MCLLTYYPPQAGVDPFALTLGARSNPHGHGYAVVTGDTITVGHGMDPTEVIGEFLDLRARHPDGDALFHSRYATHGSRTLGNCHPFPLGHDPRTVLAHNGTLPRRVHPGPYDPRSDTRIAAEDYLPHKPFGSIDTYQGARGLGSWLGRSKLVILTVDPAYRYRAYLFGEKAGTWDEGVWYSNTSYQPPGYRSLYRPRSRSIRQPSPGYRNRWVCGGCGHFDPARRLRYCRRCCWCFTCQTDFAACTLPHPIPREPGPGQLTLPQPATSPSPEAADRTGGHHR